MGKHAFFSFENNQIHRYYWFAHKSYRADPNGGTRYQPFMVRPGEDGLKLYLGFGLGAIYESRNDYGYGQYEWVVKFHGLESLPGNQGGVFSPHLYRPWDGKNKSSRAEIDIEYMRCKDGKCNFHRKVNLAVHGKYSESKVVDSTAFERFARVGFYWDKRYVKFYDENGYTRIVESPKPPAKVRLMTWAGKPNFGGSHPKKLILAGTVRSFEYRS